jgi:predicted phage baseplate assembly protein
MSTLPTPDLKPHVPPPPPGSEACGCCDGLTEATPQDLAQRPGLSSIAYRIGDHAAFSASLQTLLSSSRFAPLARLRTRDADDFTLGLIDAFACAADVLTFYQERIANESYLRTAVERVSLQSMGQLIGYRLRPGVAAETWLAFALETPPTPPAALAPEPGNFVTGVPAQRALDAGLKVQSVPGPNEVPQTFETTEPLADARAAWNALKPWSVETVRPGRGDTFTVLAGVRHNLKAGDALLIVGDEFIANPQSNHWDFRLVDSVELQPEADRTVVRWQRGLGSVAPWVDPAAQHPQVHALRKRAAAFGHNAPMWATMGFDYKRAYPGGFDSSANSFASDWPAFTLSPAGATADGGHLDTDSVQAEVAPGSFVVLAKGGFGYAAEPAPAGTYVELYRVATVAEASRSAFAISGKVSRLQLRGQHYTEQFQSAVRDTAVFLQSEPLPLAPYPVDTPVSGTRVPVQTDAEGLLPGRRLIVRGSALDGHAVVLQAALVLAHPVSPGRCELEITPPLPAALQRASVVVHANVVLASHGETVSQVLGSGQGAQAFQRFELRQLPLTWRAADNELGAAPALTLRVGDIAWQVRDTLYGSGGTERVYTLQTDEQGRQQVVFGDGVRGARLPSGSNNVRAVYRKGLGTAGNVAAGSLTQLMSRPLGLKSVANPVAAQGGTDSQAAESARASMPLYTRTLGRAVSLLDYEDFARAFSGIAKAQAQVLALPGGRTVVVSIAAADGAVLTAAHPTWQHLLAALKAAGDPLVPLQLIAAPTRTFRLGLKVRCEAERDPPLVLAAVEAALRARFSFEARALGQPVQQSDVIATAQAVPGVVAVELTRLYGGTQPVAQTLVSKQLRLLAARLHVQGGQPQAAELLVLDPAPLDLLETF